MTCNRRTAIAGVGVTIAGVLLFKESIAADMVGENLRSLGNPVFPGRGVTDPQVRVYNGEIFLYSTHDYSPTARYFTMKDWRVWRTRDFVNWRLASVLTPEETYYRKPSSNCWATDGASWKGKFYFYFSMGPKNIGVVCSESPVGPWRDPLERPLIADGDAPTEARDPGILQDNDGSNYIVFGTWDYYIARLGDDMTSLAERPRLITINNKAGPYGAGRTDDKPFLHKRGNLYYLSWGCYYSVGTSPYGPFDFRGSVLDVELADANFREPQKPENPIVASQKSPAKNWFTMDRHGSFFEFNGQWYFACNDQSEPGASPYFRDTVISYVHYRENGDIAPVRLNQVGVGQYSALEPLPFVNFFDAKGAEVREDANGGFELEISGQGAEVFFPNISQIPAKATVEIDAEITGNRAVTLEIRRGSPHGAKLTKFVIPSGFTGRVPPKRVDLRTNESLWIVARGRAGATPLARLRTLTIST